MGTIVWNNQPLFFDTPKKIILTIGLIVGVIVIVVIWKRQRDRENFEMDLAHERCAGHCRKNEDGTYNDAWDCCECLVLLKDSKHQQYGDLLLDDFWGHHRKCMCAKGAGGDYCFKLSTNFLLGL